MQSNYFTSFWHSCISCLFCLIMNCDILFNNSQNTTFIARASISFSLTYFVIDIMDYRNTKNNNVNWTKIIHHIVCMFSGIMCLQFPEESFPFAINGLCLHELSNPCWSIYRMYSDGRTFENSGFPASWSSYKILSKQNIGILFGLTFTIARFIIWPLYYFYYFPEEYIPASAKYYCVYPLFLLSSYWLYKIWRMVIHKLASASVSTRQPNIISQSSYKHPSLKIIEYLQTKTKLEKELATINRKILNNNINRDELLQLKLRKTVILGVLDNINCKITETSKHF